MEKTTGISRLLTVLALMIAPAGAFLTYNGADDLGVVSVTVFSTGWLSLSVLLYYRKSTVERLRVHRDSSSIVHPNRKGYSSG